MKENILAHHFIIIVDFIILWVLIKCKKNLKDNIYWGLNFLSILSLTISNIILMVREVLLNITPYSMTSDIFLMNFSILLIVSVLYKILKNNNIKDIGKKMLKSISFISMSVYFIILLLSDNNEIVAKLNIDDLMLRVFFILNCILLGILMLSPFIDKDYIKHKNTLLLKTLGVLMYILGDVSHIYLVYIENIPIINTAYLFWNIGINLIVLSIWCEANSESFNKKKLINNTDVSIWILNLFGITCILFIAILNISVINKILLVAFLSVGYSYVVKIDLYTHKLDLKEMNSKLIEISYKDYLTDLGNRRAFELELNRLIESVQKKEIDSFSLLLIDLNSFKKINDTYGHDVGDEVIIEVGKRLKKVIHPDRGFIARQGGDEFIVLIPNEKIKNIEVLKSEIQNELPGNFYTSNHNLMIAFSMGIAHYPFDSKIKKELIKKADTAMYAAKKNGNNSIVEYSLKAVDI